MSMSEEEAIVEKVRRQLQRTSLLAYEDLKTILNIIQKQQAALKKKNKIIDKIVANVPMAIYDFDTNITYKGREVVNYFEKKVEKENDK